jgi:hypothetical protein
MPSVVSRLREGLSDGMVISTGSAAIIGLLAGRRYAASGKTRIESNSTGNRPDVEHSGFSRLNTF